MGTGLDRRDLELMLQIGRALLKWDLIDEAREFFEVAIEEGATHVRVGTALFGPRTP